jgi:hypothetical protein
MAEIARVRHRPKAFHLGMTNQACSLGQLQCFMLFVVLRNGVISVLFAIGALFHVE